MKKINDNVFFITSNQSRLEGKINYILENKKSYTNLRSILTLEWKYKKDDYTIHVYSFDIVKNEIKKIKKDPKTKAYKAIIYLKYDKYTFEGEISFKEKKNCFNCFFFDLEFKEYHGFFEIKYPPSNI